MEDRNLLGGVIAIGSLKWEKTNVRNKWRTSNLDSDKSVLVDLPIRYGRISTTRRCTYTMVFSSKCKSQPYLGSGCFIPFLSNPLSISDILNQTRFLIKAEHNKEPDFKKRHNWGWGAVGISINPEAFKNTHKKRSIDRLLETWATKYSPGFDPEEYRVGDEDPIISNDGILEIDWPKNLTEFDFALGTLCKPEIGAYPSAKKIAQKILVNEYDEYFKQNVAYSIKTFQDKKISTLIMELDL